MKRILINATHAEEIRVALCKGNHLYDFDLENRTREQKKSNIYKGHITRIEPSLEAVFVEYGSKRQGFLPIRGIAHEYLAADPRSTNNIKHLVKEGDELIVQVEKEERGNKGAALSTYISLAGRYLVLMPNNPKGGGVSRQISGKLREEIKQILANLQLPKNMSVIVRTAGIGKSLDELQNDLNHLLDTWQNIQYQNNNFPSPRLVHQEAGVVTRAIRDYLRDDIVEIWVDHESAYREAVSFIEATMPQQLDKLHKYLDSEPMFARFGIEKQIETAYQREVRLPSGGSIVIDQTEALVSIDINSAKSTKGSDVSETAYHTNLEAAEEIARQLRLRDIGGLIVIDFIDMANDEHQKEVENRIKEATKNDRARIQFAEISKFGLLEMSRQRLRPSLEEATGFLCPRCHGTGMIRDFRSMALSIMREIEQRALQERQGELQIEVPIDIATFLLNEKRESLVYLEQDSGTRITILAQKHLKTPDFHITYHPDGFAPASYDRIGEAVSADNKTNLPKQDKANPWSSTYHTPFSHETNARETTEPKNPQNKPKVNQMTQPTPSQQPTSAVAWLSNLFAPTPQAHLSSQITSQEVAEAMESIINTGARSLGFQGQLNVAPQNLQTEQPTIQPTSQPNKTNSHPTVDSTQQDSKTDTDKKAKANTRPYIPKNKTKKPKSKPTETPNSNKRDNRSEKPQSTATENENTVNNDKSTSTDTVNTVNSKAIVVNPPTKKEPAKKIIHPEQVNLKVYKITEDKQSSTIQLSLDDSKSQPLNDDQQTSKLTPVPDQTHHVEHEDTTTALDGDTQTNSQPTLGRAINDPREVFKQFSEKLPTLTKIDGTVGQFIQQYLPNADQNISTVQKFLLAFQQFQQLSMSSHTAFNEYFKNYGYENLTQDTLAQFYEMINPVNQYQIDSGKTNCPPQPPSKRAINDPREPKTTSLCETKVAKTNTFQPEEIVYPKGSVGEFLIHTLGDVAKQMIADNKVVAAYLLATQTTIGENTQTNIDQHHEPTHPQHTDDNLVENLMDETPQTTNDHLQIMNISEQQPSNSSQEIENLDTTEEIQIKTRTTPASYKNMIETVSEQMGIVNPIGGLTLVTPKSPKPRSRKPKTTEKTTPKTRTSKKAESAVVTKKKAEDNTTQIDNNEQNLSDDIKPID